MATKRSIEELVLADDVRAALVDVVECALRDGGIGVRSAKKAAAIAVDAFGLAPLGVAHHPDCQVARYGPKFYCTCSPAPGFSLGALTDTAEAA